MSNKYSDTDIRAFRKTAESLKLYRRAEVTGDFGENLIEELYVDPLPNEHVLQTAISPNSTFIVGRKGTGKSTIFQRAQHELRKKSTATTAYLDIKSVYENSQIDPEIHQAAERLSGSLPKESLERLLLSKLFIQEVLSSIRIEIDKRINATLWEKIKWKFGDSKSKLFERMDRLSNEASNDRFESILTTLTQQSSKSHEQFSSDESRDGANLTAGVSPTAPYSSISAKIGTETSNTEAFKTTDNIEHADILMKVFNLKEYITALRDLLNECGIHHLYIFLDDFSELPEASLRIVVDALIAPLNNRSDELVKFKIAAYPNRIYYGDIDKTKIDEIYLDLYDLYGTSDAEVMEAKAVDFTRRIIETRLRHFGCRQVSDLMEPSPTSQLWRQLYFATMANPRNIGWILFFIYESTLLTGEQIGSRSIRNAARKYYEDKIQTAFDLNMFLQESYAERSSRFSLKELLESIVDRARALKRSNSDTFKRIRGTAPTSHFHIALDHESLLSSLELSFFLTKYTVLKNRDGNSVAVYALNYGLCQIAKIEFGKPAGTRVQRFRQYYAERVFDYTSILDKYVATNQEITCPECQAHHNADRLPVMRAYNMLCPSCHKGTCIVTNLSRKYEDLLKSVSESSLLPSVELQILHTVHFASEELNPQAIASELDCSHQLVGRRAKNLNERGLVTRDFDSSNRRIYQATDLANSVYFNELDANAVDYDID